VFVDRYSRPQSLAAVRLLLLASLMVAGVLGTVSSMTATAAQPRVSAASCADAEASYAQFIKKVPVSGQDIVNAEHAVLYLVNIERANLGTAALCWNDQIGGAARGHAENWRGVDRSCPPSSSWFSCSHWDSRPGYAWPPDRIAKSGYGPCANFCVGENTQNGGGVSNGSNDVPAGMVWGTPQVAVYWWMHHDGGNNKHRDAIIKADWIHAATGAATYKDRWNNNAAAYVLNFAHR
jgi:uncharacterized protein YkwD